MADLVNAARIRELIDDFGADEFAEVVAIFLDEVGEVIGPLEGGDRSALAADMHFLKGSALNLGLDRLAEFCAASEKTAASGGQPDVEGVIDLFNRSRDEFAAVVCPD